jgi:hypothetical protein
LHHFEEYTNSSCEGNFNGIKHGSAAINPYHSLLWVTETLSLTDEYQQALYWQQMGHPAQGNYTQNPKLKSLK